MRGDVNPADLFTKHLPSSIKIAQLAKLFGCEYRSGRSAAAPMLRPQDVTGDEGGQSPETYLPTFEVRDAEKHDLDTLTHMHGPDDVDRLFPILHAPPPADNVEDWVPQDHDDGHARDRAGGRRGLRGSRPPGSKQC